MHEQLRVFSRPRAVADTARSAVQGALVARRRTARLEQLDRSMAEQYLDALSNVMPTDRHAKSPADLRAEADVHERYGHKALAARMRQAADEASATSAVESPRDRTEPRR